MTAPDDLTTRALELARRQERGEDDHDRGLIVERLSWTPEERLEANAQFVRLYASLRPQGPAVREGD